MDISSYWDCYLRVKGIDIVWFLYKKTEFILSLNKNIVSVGCANARKSDVSESLKTSSHMP